MSKLSEAEDKLKALLLANATLAGLEGPPQLTEPQQPKRRHVWIYETVEDIQQSYDVTMNDPGIKDEEFSLRVGVFIARSQPATESDETAFIATRDALETLSEIVEDVVRSNSNQSSASAPPWFSAEVERTDRYAVAFGQGDGAVRGLVRVLWVRFSTRPL
jgi:hypothetical protein